MYPFLDIPEKVLRSPPTGNLPPIVWNDVYWDASILPKVYFELFYL